MALRWLESSSPLEANQRFQPRDLAHLAFWFDIEKFPATYFVDGSLFERFPVCLHATDFWVDIAVGLCAGAQRGGHASGFTACRHIQ